MNLATAQALAHTLKRGGGGQTPKSYLYTLKTQYKLFGVLIYTRTLIKNHKISSNSLDKLYFGKTPIDFRLQNLGDELYLCLYGGWTLGEYISKSPNISQEIKALIRDLSPQNQIFVLRQIAREKVAFESKTYIADKLIKAEQDELKRIYTEFYPNIFKLADNLYSYDGYFFPTNFCEISVMWHKHSLSVLEPQTLAKMRQKDFIDVGACIGDSSVLFEREFCDKNIYVFEPTKENFALLEQTLKLNNSKRIKPVNKGLGAKAGKLEIHYRADNIGGSSAVFSDESTLAETTQITTLEEFVRENKIEVGFIKVDVEGFEMEFLKGAKETICTQKPAMLLSIYHQASDYFGIKPLIESWNLGYKFKIHQGIDYSIPVETALFCEVLE